MTIGKCCAKAYANKVHFDFNFLKPVRLNKCSYAQSKLRDGPWLQPTQTDD